MVSDENLSKTLPPTIDTTLSPSPLVPQKKSIFFRLDPNP